MLVYRGLKRMKRRAVMASEMVFGGCERCGSDKGVAYTNRQFLCRECREKLMMEMERITMRILHLAQLKRDEVEGMSGSERQAGL